MPPFYTSTPASGLIPVGWGYAAILGMTIGFGTMYLPAKKYDTGNGMVFQWIVCTSLAFTLFGLHICLGSARIFPLTLLSGIFWSTGNVTVVPIIKRLGMGVGMLIWSMVNLLTGWATFRFGWFGVKPDVVHNNTLNIIGVIFTALSVVAFAFITPSSASQETAGTHAASSENGASHDTEQNVTESTGDTDPLLQQQSVSSIGRFWASQIVQRMIGIVMSVFAGVLYGVAWVPIFYVQENYDGASKKATDYAVTLGLGAFLASSVYLVLYLLVIQLRNSFRRRGEESQEIKPDVGKIPFLVLFLPTMLSGALCALGQACGLVAAEALQPAITIPIAGNLPGLLATILGIIFYREVQGTRNYIMLAVALSCAITGSTLTGLSK
ncbi:hypothetical protein Aperf_G00000070569 [Anoplocephala perfoliata]